MTAAAKKKSPIQELGVIFSILVICSERLRGCGGGNDQRASGSEAVAITETRKRSKERPGVKSVFQQGVPLGNLGSFSDSGRTVDGVEIVRLEMRTSGS